MSVHGRLRGAGAGGRVSRLKFKAVVTRARLAVYNAPACLPESADFTTV